MFNFSMSGDSKNTCEIGDRTIRQPHIEENIIMHSGTIAIDPMTMNSNTILRGQSLVSNSIGKCFVHKNVNTFKKRGGE